jgi:hypothetical protein
MIPLPKTRAEKLATDDARPSLEELYGDHLRYTLRVARSALKLYGERLMLWDDVYRTYKEAAESTVLLENP